VDVGLEFEALEKKIPWLLDRHRIKSVQDLQFQFLQTAPGIGSLRAFVDHW